MKHCPQCQQTYDDDGVFCVSDGSLLMTNMDAGQGRVVVSWDDKPVNGEIPTQYVAKPPPVASNTPDNKFLYALIGALISVILIGGAYLLMVGLRSGETETAQPRNTATPDLSAGNVSNFGANTLANAGRPVTNLFPPVANSAANAVNIPANAPVAPSNPIRTKLEQRFDRTFSGTLDNDSVEMDLTRRGSSLSGRVRPLGRSADIFVEGYIENDGSFAMEEKSDIGVVTGVYRGRFNTDGTVNGTWSKPDGDRVRPLFLRRR